MRQLADWSARLVRPSPEWLSKRTSETKKPCEMQGFYEERLKGLEPSTFCMASRRSSQLSYSRATGASIARRAAQRPGPVRRLPAAKTDEA